MEYNTDRHDYSPQYLKNSDNYMHYTNSPVWFEPAPIKIPWVIDVDERQHHIAIQHKHHFDPMVQYHAVKDADGNQIIIAPLSTWLNYNSLPRVRLTDSPKPTPQYYLHNYKNVENQNNCSSAHALVPVSTFSDILSRGKERIELDPSNLVASCAGGELSQVLYKLRSVGAPVKSVETQCVSEACRSPGYLFTDREHLAGNLDLIRSGKFDESHFKIPHRRSLTRPSYIHSKVPENQPVGTFKSNDPALLVADSPVEVSVVQSAVKEHIIKRGPVLAVIPVFQNFIAGYYSETNGVYIDSVSYQYEMNHTDPRLFLGTHVVEVIGWGTQKVGEQSIGYWLCKNSWGKNWGGLNGLVKIAMFPFNKRVSLSLRTTTSVPTGTHQTGGFVLL